MATDFTPPDGVSAYIEEVMAKSYPAIPIRKSRLLCLSPRTLRLADRPLVAKGQGLQRLVHAPQFFADIIDRFHVAVSELDMSNKTSPSRINDPDPTEVTETALEAELVENLRLFVYGPVTQALRVWSQGWRHDLDYPRPDEGGGLLLRRPDVSGARGARDRA